MGSEHVNGPLQCALRSAMSEAKQRGQILGKPSSETRRRKSAFRRLRDKVARLEEEKAVLLRLLKEQ